MILCTAAATNNTTASRQQGRKRRSLSTTSTTTTRSPIQQKTVVFVSILLVVLLLQLNLLIVDDDNWKGMKKNYDSLLSSSTTIISWEEMMIFPSKLFANNDSNNVAKEKKDYYYHNKYCVEHANKNDLNSNKKKQLQIQDIMIVRKGDDSMNTTKSMKLPRDTTKTKTTTEEREFPYPLTCRKKDLYQFLIENGLYNCDDNNNNNSISPPPKEQMKTSQNVTVAITYHVGMMKNWKVVVKDQLTTLFKCGLADITSDFMLSYSNDDFETIRQYITNITNELSDNDDDDDEALTTMPTVLKSTFDSYTSKNGSSSSSSFTKVIKATGVPWEGDAMSMIYEYCQSQVSSSSSSKTIVFYFHNKGVSKSNNRYTYNRILYWRKYMEYFLFERPQLCLYRLLYTNARTCGTNWHDKQRNHYSGNFWSTTCDYVLDVSGKPTNFSSTSSTAKRDYTCAEFWLGGRNARSHPKEWHSSLSTTSINLYSGLIEPSFYAWNNFSYLMLNDSELYVS